MRKLIQQPSLQASVDARNAHQDLDRSITPPKALANTVRMLMLFIFGHTGII